MKISVIIAAYNRKDELQELLKSLGIQTLPPSQFEVIIVDDGSTDGTIRFIQNASYQFRFRIKYFFQQNKGPGKARNLGMERSTGDILLFIDSDCMLPEDYLRKVHDAFLNEPIDAFGGPDRSAADFSAWDKAVNYTLTSFFTTGGLRGSAGMQFARYYPRSFNMGFKRGIYEEIGGFGSIYHYGEDIEFSHRILESGARVAYLPEAFVYHKRRSDPSSFVRQVFKMGRARLQLARIDPKMLEPLHMVPSALLLLAATLLIASLYSGAVRYITTIIAFVSLLGLIVLSLHGGFRSRSLAVMPLIPVSFSLQVAAYGWGMIREAVRSIIRK